MSSSLQSSTTVLSPSLPIFGTNEEKVLLPKKEVPAEIEIGDPNEVFLYKDSSDRMIATTRTPKLLFGEVKPLKVADTARVGAFLDWGLEKDLLLRRPCSRNHSIGRILI